MRTLLLCLPLKWLFVSCDLFLPSVYFFERAFPAALLLRGTEDFLASAERTERTERFAVMLPRARAFTFVPVERLLIRFGISRVPRSAALPIIVPTVPPTIAPIGPATTAPSIAPVAPPATFFRTCIFGSALPSKELVFI